MVFFHKDTIAPASLAHQATLLSGICTTEDVITQLEKDFWNKCYICNQIGPNSINIEHFVPHRGDNYLKFSWDNIFYACEHCNKIKLDKPIYDDLLNCTTDYLIEDKIHYYLRNWAKERPIITARLDLPVVHNTVDLLNAVFTGTTALNRLQASNLRNDLINEMTKFQSLMEKFYNRRNTQIQKEAARLEVLDEIRHNSNFTPFKLWILRDNEDYILDFPEANPY